MTHADRAERIVGFFERFVDLTFRTVHLTVEAPLASWTYELTMTDRAGVVTVMSSIEILEVRDSRIVAVWNAADTDGPWS